MLGNLKTDTIFRSKCGIVFQKMEIKHSSNENSLIVLEKIEENGYLDIYSSSWGFSSDSS